MKQRNISFRPLSGQIEELGLLEFLKIKAKRTLELFFKLVYQKW